MVCNFEHPQNAISPILISVSGNSTTSSARQSLKVFTYFCNCIRDRDVSQLITSAKGAVEDFGDVIINATVID